jgi:WD40 repeat protein
MVRQSVLALGALFWGALAHAQSPPREFKGHTGTVASVAISPDGKLLATGSYDNTVKLWDFATGKELHTLKGHTNQVYTVAFSPDGNLLASGSQDKTIRLWDPKEGKFLRELKGHGDTVHTVAFSPDSKLLASGSVDKTVRLWNPGDGKEAKNFGTGHKGTVFAVAFSPDGKLLASASDDKTVKVFDVPGMKELKTLSNKDTLDALTCVLFLQDNRTALSAGFDKEVRYWDSQEAKELKKLPSTPDWIWGLALSRDGKLAASAGYGGSLRVWEAQSGKLIFMEQLKEDKKKNAVTYCVTFTPDGKGLVTGHERINVARVTPIVMNVKETPEKKGEKPPEKKEKIPDKKDEKKGEKSPDKKGEKAPEKKGEKTPEKNKVSRSSTSWRIIPGALLSRPFGEQGPAGDREGPRTHVALQPTPRPWASSPPVCPGAREGRLCLCWTTSTRL